MCNGSSHLVSEDMKETDPTEQTNKQTNKQMDKRKNGQTNKQTD